MSLSRTQKHQLRKERTHKVGAAVLLAIGLCASSAWAEPPRHEGPPPRNFRYDTRFNHNHYYPPRGYAVRTLPGGYYTARYRGSPYYFSGGVWYRPYGPTFVVAAPPFGVVVPVLPSFYSTVWVGGTPYYYADDTYYVYRQDQQGYAVVTPPDETQISTQDPAQGTPGPGGPNSAQAGGPPPGAGADDFFMYPKNGQNLEKQNTDRYECHRWAADQTGFDPTQPGGSVDPAQAGSKRADYGRAFTACLDARGYSVK